MSNMVAAGEIPLALTVYSYKPDQLARAGAPIRTLYLAPVIALATGVSVTRCTTRPHAALLFYEFMLRDAQDIMAKRDIAPTNLKVKPLPEGLEITMMDPDADARPWRQVVGALAQDRHQTAIASTACGGPAGARTKLNHHKAIKPS